MLKKEFRLKKRKHFNYIYKKGNSAGCPFVSVTFIASKHPTKIGFSVSKKIGNAVVRNKVIRRMRECVKEFLPNLKEKTNYIFVARSGIETLSKHEITKNMLSVLKKQKLIEGI